MKIDKIIRLIKTTSKYESIYSGLMLRKDIDILKKTCKNVVINEYKPMASINKIYVVIDLYKKKN